MFQTTHFCMLNKKTVLFSILLILNSVLPVQADLTMDSKNKVNIVFQGVKTDPQTGDLITVSPQEIPIIDSDESLTLPAQTRITEFYGKQLLSDGQQYLVTLWNAQDTNDESPGGGAAILAVFSTQNDQPLDLMNVKTDISVYFSEQVTPLLGKNETFVISNSHFNSNESYLDSSIFQIHQSKLQKIDSIFTFSTRGGCENFDETLSWKTDSQIKTDHPPFTAIVTLERRPQVIEDSSCPKKKTVPRHRVFSKTYQWNHSKQRYEGNNKEFEALQRFNEKNL